MKLDKIANSKNDEYYTPEYAVKPLLNHLKAGSTIWCPFDKNESNFVKLLKDKGHNVINTHIDYGQDFFTTEVPICDYIISNPPYSIKTEVLEYLFILEVPFAMLVGVAGLFESKRRFNMFMLNDFELMYFNKRISYMKDFCEVKPSINPPFSSVYVCHKILYKQIIFKEIL